MKIPLTQSITALKQHLKDPLFKDPLYKNSFFLMVNSAAVSILGFLFWLVAARCYSSKEVGLATALISVMMFFPVLSSLGFHSSLIRYLDKERDKQSMINSCLTVSGLLSILLVIVFLTGINIWSPKLSFIKENFFYAMAFIVFSVANSILLLQEDVFVALRCTEYLLFQNVIWRGLSIIVLIILAKIFANFFGIFLSLGIAICVGLLIRSFLFIPIILPKYLPVPTINKRMLKDIMHFSIGNYISRIFYMAPGAIFPLLIVNTMSPEATAYFYMAWAIAGILFVIPVVTTLSLFAEGSHNPEELSKNVIKAIKLMFVLLIPAILLLIFFGDKILLAFGRRYSEEGFELLQVFSVSAIPLSLNLLYVAVKRVQIKVKSIVYTYVSMAIFTIGISYILMAEIGLIGVGMGWFLGQTIVAISIGLVILKEKVRNNS